MQINTPRTVTLPAKVPLSIADLKPLFPSTPEGDAQWLRICTLMSRVEQTGPADRDFVFQFYEALGLQNLVQNYIRLDAIAVRNEMKSLHTAIEALFKAVQAARSGAKDDAKLLVDALVLAAADINKASLEGFKAATRIDAATANLKVVATEASGLKAARIWWAFGLLLILIPAILHYLVISAVNDAIDTSHVTVEYKNIEVAPTAPISR